MKALPFIERYRPRSLDGLIGNPEILARLRYFAAQGNLPNILLTGGPGLGKTTIALCLANQMLGAHRSVAFLELNASDERNVSDIRAKVKTFAQKQVTLPTGIQKLVFLDECDAMTEAAQQVLRRIMDDETGSTRFCLACNNISKVIEPVQSRCCVLRIMPPTQAELVKYLQEICEKEGVKNDTEALKELISISGNDVRSCLNSLQLVADANDKVITVAGVQKALSTIDVKVIDQVMNLLTSGKFDDGWTLIDNQLNEGYNYDDIYNAMFRYALSSETEINDVVRASMLRILASLHAKSKTTVSSPLQLCRLLAELFLQLSPH
ncbi:Replication factor C, subunit 4 [Giardia lamblia P15]|uniref:Replication factor C, subunit 4 n=1 Tax=Giardia intestinalis (strain P15) TaxID=658858 RepID=E1F3Q1_GIAIA|nr:Replication factor C, subunit 4 [Giardia lamblia P15]